VTLVNGSATSPVFGANLAPGNYCVGLVYVNDGNSFYSGTYAGGVVGECFTVTTAVTSVTTSLSINPIVVGGSVHDSATLTGATPGAGGTVGYRFYPSLASCQADTTAFPATQPTGGTSAGTVTVTNGVVPDSDTVSFPNAGTFFWAAFYSGDPNNSPAASACVTEALVVSPNQPSISTSLSANPIVVDGSAHDSATLTGATSGAGGTVQYRVYESLASCQADTAAFPGTQPTGGTSAGTVTVTNGAVPDSDDVTFVDAGTFFWAAFYSGDTNNAATASACATEALVVSPTQAPITTSLSAGSIPAGGSVHDSATLIGATSTAGGTVQYRFYPSLASCETDTAAFPGTQPTGGTSAGTVTVTDAAVPDSDTVAFPDAGTFFWAAFYSGDPDNDASASACVTEALVVQPLSPAITTSLSANPIVVGGSAHDSATLTGATPAADSSVQYRFYPSLASCETDTAAFPGTQPTGGTSAGTVTVTDAAVPDSDTVTFPNAGTFFWAAFYAGDPNNNAAVSACATEALVVSRTQPSIATSLSAGSMTAGGSVHDSATLTGATSTAGGTVGYRFYPSLASCQADTTAFTGTQPTGGTSAGTVTVANGAVPDSETLTFPNAGTFFWAAFYSGDPNNGPAASTCADEALVVSPTQPSISTSLSANPIVAGGSVHDSATLTGATSGAGGTVGYRFYPSLAACQADTTAFPGTQPTGGTAAGTVAVTNGSVPNSETVTFPDAGTFFWAAFYSGDPNNAAAVSACADEALVVSPTQPSITTSLSANSIPVGGSVHDTATLTGATSGAGGTVQYRFYPSLSACQADSTAFPGTQPTGGTPAGTVTVTNATVPNSDAVTFPSAGTFFWAAFYSGDTSNGPADSACGGERLDVTTIPATPTPTATPSPLPVTGTPTALVTGLAGCLVTAGLAILLVARRQRRVRP
jgi:hypothetical protein